MALPAGGAVGLSGLRFDLDLPLAGRFAEEHVLNRVCKQAGPASLNEFRGVVLGTQLQLVDYTSGAPWTGVPRWQAGYIEYLDSTGGSVAVSGNRLKVTATSNRDPYDRAMEVRITGLVWDPGTYKFSGSTEARHGDPTGQMHMYLLANSAGYLAGSQQILVAYEKNGLAGANGQQFHSYNVNLTSGMPYITAVFRNVYLGGGSGEQTAIDFWDWKLEKI